MPKRPPRSTATRAARAGATLLLLALTPAAGGGGAAADTVTLEPSKDNTLFEHPTGALSNGAGEFLFAGRTLQGSNDRRRALLAFDVAANLPAGSEITGAELTLEMSLTIAGSTPVELRRLATGWGQAGSDAEGGEGGGAPAQSGDATWLHTFFDTDFWASPGGDFAAAPSASQSVGGSGTYTWGSTAAMVADVQSWLDEPASNFGWLLLGDESSVPTAKRFNSRENTDELTVPRLVLTFIPPIFADGFESGDTGAWSQVAGGTLPE
jgi:hypothetical protein